MLTRRRSQPEREVPSHRGRLSAVRAIALVAVGATVAPWMQCRNKKVPPTVPSASSAHDAGNRPAQGPGRRVIVEPFTEDLEESLSAVEDAIAKSADPIESLEIDASGAPFGDTGLRRVVERHRDLAPVRLTLSDTKITAKGLAVILASAIPSRLESLDLRDNYLGVGGARLLAETIRLAALKELNLGRNHIHAGGAEALASARDLRRLERLELEYNFIGPAGAEALAKNRAMPRLRDLGLSYNYLKDEGAQAISGGRWPELALLDVASNEIGEAGARALAQSSLIGGEVFLWFAQNPLDDAALKRLGLARQLRLEGFPLRENRVTLGEADAFDLPKRPTAEAAAPPPDALPTRIEFRELWIWEFGLVGEFPTFMTPERRPGNGKSRSFSWLDRATLSIGGYWLNVETFAEVLAEESKAAPGDRIRVERWNAHTALVRRSGPKKIRVARLQSAHGALVYIDFAYDSELDAYFAPIAERVVRSLYFDRAHLKKQGASLPDRSRPGR